MKKSIIYFTFILFTHCSVYRAALPIESCDLSSAPTKNIQPIEAALDELITGGVPGCALAVYSEDGLWSTAKGLAKIETNTPMQSCHLQYLQSISKTYLAVAVLKLYEQGKIKLDTSFAAYLPSKFTKYVTRANEISVRMLLNHTSGVPEYNFSPSYVSELLQHPDQFFPAEEYLHYIDGKSLDFEPGTKYSYRNTNYVILALMVDAITGDHAKYISDVIFQPLQLANTFYRSSENYLTYPRLVNTYWDRHSDGIVENVSLLQRTNVASMIGDDGIVTTPEDAVRFLKGLLENQLLNESTMKEMKTFARDTKGNERYGLGLARASMVGQTGYGHSGGGLGAGCELYYFPEKKTYVFVAINLGTVTDSPLHTDLLKAKDKMYEAIFNLN